MELDQIKKHLKDIFEKEGIKHVFHVDDRANSFDGNKSQILAALRKIENIRDIKPLNGLLTENEIDTNDDQEVIISNIEKRLIIENLDLMKSLMKVFDFSQQSREDDEDNDAFDIQKYFEPGKYTILEPEGAVDTIVEKVKTLATEGRVLVLFDLDLKEAQGEFVRITGADLYISLKEKDTNNQCVCSIFTHLAKTTDDEIQKRQQLISNNPEKLDESNLFVLAKKRKNDHLMFGDGIKKVILNPHYEKVKKYSIELLKDAFQSSIIELNTIDTYEFDHIILQSSNIEGVWAGETLLRIFEVIFNREIRGLLVEQEYAKRVNPFFEKAIKLARNSFPIDLGGLPEVNRNRIRNIELYEEGKIVNGLFAALNNGDIFEIEYAGAILTYILVAQECDIILRSNGKRNRKNDFFTLLKIDFKNRDEVDADIKAFTSEYGLKNYYFSNKYLLNNYDNSDSEKIGVIDFRNELMIFATILDLTSFNEDGSAKFDPAKQYPTDAFSQAVRNRFKKVVSICNDKVEFLKKIVAEFTSQGVSDPQSLALRFVEKVSPTNPSVGRDNPFHTNVFDFGVTRVMRLKVQWANKLLERYGYYLSRAADLPDYTDLVDPKRLTIS